MRFIFKTNYEDDIRLLPHSGYVWTYGTLLVLLAIAPFVLSSYIMSQLVFVCIYATVGVGLLILSGFTGPGLARARGVPCDRRLHGRLSAAISMCRSRFTSSPRAS